MYLLTGAAGFIGFHVGQRLLEEGADILGVDDVNANYSPPRKCDRLVGFATHPRFRFVESDVAREGALGAARPAGEVTGIVHLAAQEGGRQSLDAPFDYEMSRVLASTADHIQASERFGVAATTTLHQGIERFFEWRRSWRP